MKGLNRISLIGNVGSEPDIRTLEKNIKVAKFSLATTESFRDDTGQMHTNTDWLVGVKWSQTHKTTLRYTHVSNLTIAKIKSPFDHLNLEKD